MLANVISTAGEVSPMVEDLIKRLD